MQLIESGYREKSRDYFDIDRHDLLALVPSVPHGRVLEVGAGEGSLLVAIKRSGKAREVIGVELMAARNGAQNRPELDRFIIADIETETLDIAPESIDVLICGDVLEHLRDPWTVLSRLARLLKTGGTAVLSLPNILHWHAIGTILRGDFRYAPAGVLDRTHLRFFCRKNMIELIEGAHLEIVSSEPSFMRHRALARDRFRNALTLGFAERFFAQQYLYVARKRAS